jgi:hypothetical protein
VRLLDTNGFANAHMRPFSANTGQVFVKIGRERWPAGQAVSDASTVEQIKVVRGSCPTLCVHPRCLRANGAPKPVSVGAVCPGRIWANVQPARVLTTCKRAAKVASDRAVGVRHRRSRSAAETRSVPPCTQIAKHLDFLNRVSLRDKTKILLAKPTPCDCLGKFRNIVIDGVGLITSFKAVLFEEWRSCW